MGKKSDYMPNPFTEEEKEIIINTAKGQFKNLLQFCFWAGLRTSELIALKWEDVNFKNKVINIKRGKVEGEENSTKNKYSIRQIICYQMRHTYASTLLSNGENVMWVASQMGHANAEMILKRYGKWIPKKNDNGYNFSGTY